MSWNDLEIRHRGKFSYQVPVDECKVSFVTGKPNSYECNGSNTRQDNPHIPSKYFPFQHESTEWAKTVISMRNVKPTRLPIVDVAVRDVGNERKKFKLEIGQVNRIDTVYP